MQDLVVRIWDDWEIVEPLGHLACVNGEVRSEGAQFVGAGECGPRLPIGEECLAVGVGDRQRIDVSYIIGPPNA